MLAVLILGNQTPIMLLKITKDRQSIKALPFRLNNFMQIHQEETEQSKIYNVNFLWLFQINISNTWATFQCWYQYQKTGKS